MSLQDEKSPSMHASLAVRRCRVGQLLRQPCYGPSQLASLHPEGFSNKHLLWPLLLQENLLRGATGPARD